MNILDEVDETFLIAISDSKNTTTVSFDYLNKDLTFLKQDSLSGFLKDHEFQFRKLLHVKKPETFYKGFELKFSIREDKDVKSFNDLNQILVL
ncbi:MAG: hypothetical protein K8R74_00540, partial [Bacteroidales bacterium]|nr:hypothetical protein [Bacteroidales bacterium]